MVTCSLVFLAAAGSDAVLSGSILVSLREGADVFLCSCKTSTSTSQSERRREREREREREIDLKLCGMS